MGGGRGLGGVDRGVAQRFGSVVNRIIPLYDSSLQQYIEDAVSKAPDTSVLVRGASCYEGEKREASP